MQFETVLKPGDVRLSKELDKLIKILNKAADYAEKHGDKKVTTHLKNSLHVACVNFLDLFNQENLILIIDLEFYKIIPAFLEEESFLKSVFVRSTPPEDQLFADISAVLVEIYNIVYGSKAVRDICMSSTYIGEQISRFHTVDSTEQLIGTMFHKIILLEKAYEEMDDKVDHLSGKLDKLYRSSNKDGLNKLQTEFIDAVFAAYALHAASDIALEELGVIKDHLRKLLET